MTAPLDLLRSQMAAWERRDLDGFLEVLTPDFHLDWSRSTGPLRGVYVGHEQAAQFFKAWWDVFDDMDLSLGEVLVEAEDRLCVEMVGRNRGRSSGLTVEGGGFSLFTVREGKFASLTMFDTREQALAALGSED